jgi:hypothetical protein
MHDITKNVLQVRSEPADGEYQRLEVFGAANRSVLEGWRTQRFLSMKSLAGPTRNPDTN